MRVGAYRQDITPFDLTNTRLAGFGPDRMAWGVLDPLYARVLYLSDGTTEIAVAALDLIGLTLEATHRIRRKVRNLAPECVHVCCTHTHAGPDTIGFWGRSILKALPIASGIDPLYQEWLEDEIAYAIDKAKNDAVPLGSVRVGVDRKSKQKWSRNIRNEALVDEDLTAIRFADASGEPVATVVHFGSHPEALWSKNHKISADYCASLIETVEEEIGGVGIFWNGALGGMVTIGYDETMPTGRRVGWVRDVGRALGAAAVDALGRKAETYTPESVSLKRATVRLPLESRILFVARNLGIFDRDMDGDDLVGEVSLVTLGPIRLALFPGEPAPAVGLRVKELLGAKYGLVVSIADDEIGYVLPEPYFDDRSYKYESSMSVGRKTADRLCEALAELVRQP